MLLNGLGFNDLSGKGRGRNNFLKLALSFRLDLFDLKTLVPYWTLDKIRLRH